MRIKRQHETFAYRFAADNPFDPSDDKKKKYFDLDNGAIPDMNTKRDLTNSDDVADSAVFQQMDNSAQGTGGKVQKMVVTPGVSGSGGSGGSNTSRPSGPVGTPDGSGILPNARPLYDTLMQQFPGADIGGYRVDNFHEHDHGALDFMHPSNPDKVIQDAFAAGAPYVLWQQQQINPDGSRIPMENRGDATQNHFDHIHIAPIGG